MKCPRYMVSKLLRLLTSSDASVACLYSLRCFSIYQASSLSSASEFMDGINSVLREYINSLEFKM